MHEQLTFVPEKRHIDKICKTHGFVQKKIKLHGIFHSIVVTGTSSPVKQDLDVMYKKILGFL